MEDMNRLADSLRELANPPIPTIDEYLFVKRYLPLFLTRDELTPVSAWLEVAKHPFSPVNVVKNGKVLFTVPPLCRQVSVRSESVHDSVYEILSLARKKEMISPVLGANYLKEKLDQLIIADPASLDTIRQWNTIFEYYGLDTVDLSSLPTPTTSTSQPPPMEVVDFEDF